MDQLKIFKWSNIRPPAGGRDTNMKFIVGTKLNMTQLFDESGKVTPVTAVSIAPNTVTKVKTVDSDGYTAVQVGFGDQKESRVSKALLGAFGGKAYKGSKEFRTGTDTTVAVGDVLDATLFAPGDVVTVTGTSKSKGFQGVVKRHGFHGAPASHGHHHVLRHVGSIGQRFPQHTLKGSRGPGRDGQERVAIRGLKVVAVDIEAGLIAVRGAVPGAKGTLVEVTAK